MYKTNSIVTKKSKGASCETDPLHFVPLNVLYFIPTKIAKNMNRHKPMD